MSMGEVCWNQLQYENITDTWACGQMWQHDEQSVHYQTDLVMNKEAIYPPPETCNFKQVCILTSVCLKLSPWLFRHALVMGLIQEGGRDFQTQTSWWEDKPHPSAKRKKLTAQFNTDWPLEGNWIWCHWCFVTTKKQEQNSSSQNAVFCCVLGVASSNTTRSCFSEQRQTGKVEHRHFSSVCFVIRKMVFFSVALSW